MWETCVEFVNSHSCVDASAVFVQRQMFVYIQGVSVKMPPPPTVFRHYFYNQLEF